MPLNKNTDNRYEILNTYVNAISMDETIRRVEEIIKRGIPTQHVVINASKVNLMEKDLKLRKIVNACPLINADGASIVWAAKKLGVPLKERVTVVCVTGQHRQMLDQVLEAFQVEPDYDLSIMKERQTLFDVTTNILNNIKEVLEKEKPNVVLVHGDTSTTFVTALAWRNCGFW